MKQLEEIINGNGYAAVSVGPMNELSEYVLTRKFDTLSGIKIM